MYSSVVSTILSTLQIEGFDVKALRAFRVLRPLRLVSGVPSKSQVQSIMRLQGEAVKLSPLNVLSIRMMILLPHPVL